MIHSCLFSQYTLHKADYMFRLFQLPCLSQFDIFSGNTPAIDGASTLAHNRNDTQLCDDKKSKEVH
jgi:hypothetical protein